MVADRVLNLLTKKSRATHGHQNLGAGPPVPLFLGRGRKGEQLKREIASIVEAIEGTTVKLTGITYDGREIRFLLDSAITDQPANKPDPVASWLEEHDKDDPC